MHEYNPEALPKYIKETLKPDPQALDPEPYTRPEIINPFNN